MPTFIDTGDLPGADEFPQGDVGDQLRVAKVAESRRKKLLKHYERKEAPGQTLHRIMEESKRIDAIQGKTVLPNNSVFVAEAKPDPVHHQFDRKEPAATTFRRIIAAAKPK